LLPVLSQYAAGWGDSADTAQEVVILFDRTF
jgi:hypothetical protein